MILGHAVAIIAPKSIVGTRRPLSVRIMSRPIFCYKLNCAVFVLKICRDVLNHQAAAR